EPNLYDFGASAAPAIPYFVDQLTIPMKRQSALRVLGAIGQNNSQILRILLKQLDEYRDIQTTAAIAEALGDYRGDDAERQLIVVTLRRMLKDDRPLERSGVLPVRNAAIQGLGKLGPSAESAVVDLEALVEEYPRGDSRQALSAIEHINPERAKAIKRR